MAFSIGNGLSAMGGAISQTAGAMALDAQKADLERQRDILANDLATGRDTALETQRQAGASALSAQGAQQTKDLIPAQTAGQIQVVQATSTAQIAAHAIELKQDTDAAVDKLGKMSTPDALAAQHAITMVSSIPNLQIQIGDDGNANTFNPETGKVSPLIGTDGNPVRFQNPALAQAVTTQAHVVEKEQSDLDYNLRDELRTVATLNAKASPKVQQAALDAVHAKYDPLLAQARAQVQSLTSALGIRTGITNNNGVAAGAPSLDSMMPNAAKPPANGVNLQGGGYNNWLDKGLASSPAMSGP